MHECCTLARTLIIRSVLIEMGFGLAWQGCMVRIDEELLTIVIFILQPQDRCVWAWCFLWLVFWSIPTISCCTPQNFRQCSRNIFSIWIQWIMLLPEASIFAKRKWKLHITAANTTETCPCLFQLHLCKRRNTTRPQRKHVAQVLNHSMFSCTMYRAKKKFFLHRSRSAYSYD